LNRLKKLATNGQLIFFSDEKNFLQDQKIYRKNNPWLCADISEVPIVMVTKFSATVMVLGVVSNEGNIMPPHFFEKGLKINAQEYLRSCRMLLNPGWTEWPMDVTTCSSRTARLRTTRK
jgi:hypothetical protein